MSKRNAQGFTLVELMITIAIIGILASIAYPSYTDYVVTSNRAEAQRELVRIANLQEQYFVNTRTYTATLTDVGLAANPYVTDTGNYSIAATIADSGLSFTLTATAQGNQASKDSTCLTLTVDQNGEKGGTSTSCWES